MIALRSTSCPCDRLEAFEQLGILCADHVPIESERFHTAPVRNGRRITRRVPYVDFNAVKNDREWKPDKIAALQHVTGTTLSLRFVVPVGGEDMTISVPAPRRLDSERLLTHARNL